jgi:hypothetical protein
MVLAGLSGLKVSASSLSQLVSFALFALIWNISPLVHAPNTSGDPASEETMMVTRKEQTDQLVSPKNVLVLMVALIVIGLIAALIGQSPARVQTAVYTQDSGNAGGLNNSLTTGPVGGVK